MSITGGIKFFGRSICLRKEGASAAASSGEAAEQYPLNTNKLTRWESVGSDDSTVETYVITFDSATFDRLYISGHNLKNYTITYGSSPTAFANVIDLDSNTPTTGIAETAYDKDTSYYEFDSVTTTQINITMNTTQEVDAEKFLTVVLAMTEIGTLDGYPLVSATRDRNENISRALSRKAVVQKSFETFGCQLNFKTYPIQADITLIEALFDREEDFYIWLCGGKYGTSKFCFEQNMWRLQDLFAVNTTGGKQQNYWNNNYINPVNTSINLIQTAD